MAHRADCRRRLETLGLDAVRPDTPGRVDFVWVIYHVEPPLVRAPGTVHMKFGH
jgi:hypothetical protein